MHKLVNFCVLTFQKKTADDELTGNIDNYDAHLIFIRYVTNTL